jgi:uncharacterized protein
MSVLQVSVSEIREAGGIRVVEKVDPAVFQEGISDATLSGPVSVDLDWTIEGGEVTLRGQVSGEWKLECCRCLGPSRESFKTRVEGAFGLEKGTCDAAEDVRQAIVLAVPMQSYCKPDCRGLCSTCGGNRNLKECGHPNNA